MTDAANIVAAMQVDIDRLGNHMGARTTRLAREAVADLARDLDRPGLGSWGIASKVAAMAQVRAGIERLALQQAGVLTSGARAVSEASQRRMVALVGALDKRFTGAAAPLRFDTLAWLDANHRQLSQTRLRIYGPSFARYGGAAVAEIEGELAKLALTGQPWTKARAKVQAAIRDVVGDRQWMVDRILRTETSAIYNGTNLAAMIAEDTPESPMLKRLIATFDKVTGHDSVQVHGQVRPVREMFNDGKRLYAAPPNRPHDREIVVPHRARWGPNLPRLSRPAPEPEETSAPALPVAPGRARAVDPPPALARRLALAAGAVTLLAGRLQERRRSLRALPLDQRLPPVGLERELSDAQLELAAARLAADIDAGGGIDAVTLQRGETITAGGLAVRVVSARLRGDVVEFVFQVGDTQLRGEVPARLRLPFRRAAPTMTATAGQGVAAVALLAEAMRQAVATLPASGTSPRPAL